MNELFNISSIDGRYHSKTKELAIYFSEAALINYRIKVECEYFIFLTDFLYKKRKIKNRLSESEKKIIREIYLNGQDNALIIKKIETEGFEDIKPTNHDVKAVEYFLRKKFEGKISINNEFLHFGLTSEDINNISYSMMIYDFLREKYIPLVRELLEKISDFVLKYHSSLFPARTHGQIASPTTFGKEMKNFACRIRRKLTRISSHNLYVKLNGAVGNYNALYAAYPEIDWIDFTEKFISYLNSKFSTSFVPNLYTTQIEPHDSWVELFSDVKHLNSILIGFCQDIWRYISDELIILKKLDWEIGSSTMPHKVNPIDFENAEGNLQTANSIFNFFTEKFPVSRMQRDLTDSTVERNIGTAFSHTYIAIISIINGLSKIQLNTQKSSEMVNSSPQIYAEAIQTVLRKHAIKNAYEKLKDFSRGRKITQKDLVKFIEELDVNHLIKKELKKIISLPYTGLASKLALKKLEEEQW